jgi:hypothetical protein
MLGPRRAIVVILSPDGLVGAKALNEKNALDFWFSLSYTVVGFGYVRL